jgi:hypothetical protein
MTEQRGYLNGARSELVSARPLAGCSAISAARPPPVARVTIEIRQQPRMVATPARSQQRGMRDAVLESCGSRSDAPNDKSDDRGRAPVPHASMSALAAGCLRLTRVDGEACLSKPYTSDDIVSAPRVVEQMAGSGTVTGPVPRTLLVLTGPTLEIHTSGGEAGEVARLRRQQAALALFGSFTLGEADLGKVLTEAAHVCAEGLGVAFCKKGVIGRAVSRAVDSSPQGRAFIAGQPWSATASGDARVGSAG